MNRSTAWVLAAFAGGVLLHIDRVPPWAAIIALVCIAWRAAAALRRLPLPGRAVRLALSIAPAIGVLTSFHTLNGLAAGSALLVSMGAVKLLETKSTRDEVVVIGAALFLLLAACLARADLVRLPMYLIEMWIAVTALAVSSQAGHTLSSRAAGSLALRSLALAVPLAVILFLFFPRVAGSFWALPASGGGRTGLSDTMSPGSISELTASDEIVFRAAFRDALPPPQDRYWRGPVLHDFDGYTWRRANGLYYRASALRFTGRDYAYRIALEPQPQRWWFALESLRQPPEGNVILTFDRQLLGPEPLAQVINYNAVSNTHAVSDEPISLAAERLDLRLPRGRNLRSVQLALKLREKSDSDADFVRRTLEYFRTGNFRYSLTPPLLDPDSIDDFLFHTHLGFCGHFASAFTMLMRAGGVPARVVTGYLGGERNPINGYLVIRQSDAHAWSEVWIDGQGWTRVDPTAVVAPERLQRGLLDLLPSAMSTERRLFSNPLLQQLRFAWDATNAWWNDQVLNFNLAAQLSFLSKLGFRTPDWHILAWVLGGGLALWLGAIGLLLSRAPAPKPSKLARNYARLCRRLARAGMPRPPWQGPLAYAEAIERERPDLAPRAVPEILRYAESRYGPGIRTREL